MKKGVGKVTMKRPKERGRRAKARYASICIASFFLWADISIAEPTAARTFDDAEMAIVAAATAVALKDPTSAKFKWGPLATNNAHLYCGMINAKNSYGAYVGDVPFITFVSYVDGKVSLAYRVAMGSASADAPETIAVYNQCADNGYGREYFIKLRFGFKP